MNNRDYIPFDGHYVIDAEHRIRPTRSMREWGACMQNDTLRRVGRTKADLLEVSTVFLGIDHNWSDRGTPILFETMIFDGQESLDYQTRCSTWAEAEAMHKAGVEWAVRRTREASSAVEQLLRSEC